MKFLGLSFVVRDRLALTSTILSLRACWLALGQHDDDTGGVGVVEEDVGQQYYAVYQVLLHEPLANVALAVLMLWRRSRGSSAPVSRTTEARPRSFRQASVCWSQAQSPLPVVTPPAVRNRSKGSFSKMSWLKFWFHMGLATTISWPVMRPVRRP